MSDDEKTAEELLSQSKNQRRHNTDAPTTGGETDTNVDDTEETVDLAGAVAEVYDEEGAKKAILESFDYSGTAQKYADRVDLTVTVRAGILSKEIEYTDEAVRSLTAAERRLRRDVTAEIERLYSK